MSQNDPHLSIWEKFILLLQGLGAVLALGVALFSIFQLVLTLGYRLSWWPYEPLFGG